MGTRRRANAIPIVDTITTPDNISDICSVFRITLTEREIKTFKIPCNARLAACMHMRERQVNTCIGT